ncbi:MAG: class I SAM-dependent methyltransferase [Candidatus Aminicenantales bacterium]
MKRPPAQSGKIQLIPALLAAGLLAAMLFLVRGPGSEKTADHAPSGTAETVTAPDEITVRNVIDVPIRYMIAPQGATGPGTERVIPAGALDRHPSTVLLVISFDRNGRTITRSLSPGRPYSFRYDENGLLEIWLGSHGLEGVEDLAPYVPTPSVVVDKMLEMAAVGPEDTVFDIGCGDGRIVIAAAQKRGARGVGIDIDPERILESRENARKAMVEHLVRFVQEDALRTDISSATVVTLYLLPESNALLRPKLENELKPGTRVISHNYGIPGWDDREVSSASLDDESGTEHTIFLFRR